MMGFDVATNCILLDFDEEPEPKAVRFSTISTPGNMATYSHHVGHPTYVYAIAHMAHGWWLRENGPLETL